MKNIKITSALTLGFLLLGCDSRIDAVNQEMANIRNQPPLPIEPAPDFMPVETFNYAAHQIKSPFLPSSLAAELKIMAGKRVISKPITSTATARKLSARNVDHERQHAQSGRTDSGFNPDT